MNKKLWALVVIIGIAALSTVFVLRDKNVFKPRVYLPPQRPADFAIALNSSPGMLPQNTNVYLSLKQSYIETYNNGAHSKNNFILTQGDMDTLYEILQKNNFTSITWHEEEIYDRGGTSVTVSWGNTNIIVANAGMSVIDDKWQADFDNLYNELSAFVSQKIELLRQPITFTFTPNLVNGKNRLYFTVDNSTTNSLNQTVSTTPLPSKVVYKLLPGEHSVSVTLYDGKSEPPYLKTLYDRETIIAVPSTTASAWLVELAGSGISIKQKK